MPKGFIVISFMAFVTYLLSVVGVVPDHVGTLRLDLSLYLALFVLTIVINRISVMNRQV